MKFYKEIQRVVLGEDAVKKAKAFAIAIAGTTNYSDTNQANNNKVINDHFISKLGEEAARMVMQQFAAIAGPDYTIYKAGDKSWLADLFVNNAGIAVKTQKRSAAKKYSLSWTFQCSRLRSDPILLHPKAWVLFVEFDDLSATPVCYVYPPLQIEELQFEQPVLAYLKDHKKVVYARTLKLV